jgi:CubicO group peptidase (beta-lactamase class C family)
MKNNIKYLKIIYIILLLFLNIFFSCDNTSEIVVVEEKKPNYSVSAIELNPDLASTRDYWPTEEWRTKTPQETGMDTELLNQIMEYIKQDEVYSTIIVKNGYIVLEHYGSAYYNSSLDESSFFEIYSCTKSITSSLIGILIDQGKIKSVKQPLTDFFPEIKKMQDPRKEHILLSNALTMRLGLEWDHTNYNYNNRMRVSNDWSYFVLEQPVVEPPGEVFHYGAGASHLLSCIISRTTGMIAEEFAMEYLFEKIGIKQVLWAQDKQGNSNGGWGIAMQSRDMARFGFLFLNNGIWNGNQLISKEWIAASTADHTGGFANSYGFSGHYGYQWWISSAGTENTKIISARGSLGQYILIVPTLDLVVVFTSNLPHDFWNPYIYLIYYIIPACLETRIHKDIIVKKIDPFYYCAIEMNGSTDKVTDTFQTLYSETYNQHILKETIPFIIYNNNPFNIPESKLVWEVGLTLNKKVTANKPLVIKKWNHILHISKTISGDADDNEQDKTITHMHDWIKQHNYTISGPLMKRLFYSPTINGTSSIERIEFLIPIEGVMQ